MERKKDLRDLLNNLLGKDLWELQYDLRALLAHRDELSHRIRIWAKKYSLFYHAHGNQPVTRKQLLNRKLSWYVDRVTGHQRKTSGTTGIPLEYRLWEPQRIMIAKNNEILREFGVRRVPRVLRIKTSTKLAGPSQFALTLHTPKPTEPLMSAGAESAQTHVVSHHPAACTGSVCHYISSHLHKYPDYDIIITSWSFMSTWLQYAQATRLARLCWTTCESVIQDEVEQCRDRGFFDQFCDHMRCWDGGASFFTCQYGTYHCMDWLCDMQQGDRNQLETTDFFNLAAPFIRYRNGDEVRLMKTWAKCQCGRYYRPMQFYGKRPCFLVRSRGVEIPSIAITDVVERFPVFIQAVCGDSHITIISDGVLTEEQQARLQELLPVQMFFRNTVFHRTGTHQKLQRVVKV